MESTKGKEEGGHLFTLPKLLPSSFVLLLNWYVIGVFLAMFGLRKFLQGSSITSGVLLGVSATSNLVTALPAFGMALTASNMRKKREHFILSFLGTFVNLPFIVPSRSLPLVTIFWTYRENWFVEGTWMLGFFHKQFSLKGSSFSLLLFAPLSAIILYVWFRERRRWKNIGTTVTDSERSKN